jgi:hypothetical protein
MFWKSGSIRQAKRSGPWPSPFPGEYEAIIIFNNFASCLAQGAAFCGMNVYDFISTASQAGIPIIDYSIEDVEQELAQFV